MSGAGNTGSTTGACRADRWLYLATRAAGRAGDAPGSYALQMSESRSAAELQTFAEDLFGRVQQLKEHL